MTLTDCSLVICEGLEKKIGCPVIPAQNVKRNMKAPYVYFTCYSPSRNDKDGLKHMEGETLVREELADAYITFTVVSKNRMENGECVFADKEVQSITEKAHGYFKLDGHSFECPDDTNIVIRSVDEATKADEFEADEFTRCARLTIRFGYTRTDKYDSGTVRNVVFKGQAKTRADAEATARAIADNLFNDLLKGFDSLK